MLSSAPVTSSTWALRAASRTNRRKNKSTQYSKLFCPAATPPNVHPQIIYSDPCHSNGCRFKIFFAIEQWAQHLRKIESYKKDALVKNVRKFNGNLISPKNSARKRHKPIRVLSFMTDFKLRRMALRLSSRFGARVTFRLVLPMDMFDQNPINPGSTKESH